MITTSLLRSLVLPACLGASAVLAQSAQPQPTTAQVHINEAQVGQMFGHFDADGDKKISRAEAEAVEALSKDFRKFDKNGDGFLSLQEFTPAAPLIPW